MLSVTLLACANIHQGRHFVKLLEGCEENCKKTFIFKQRNKWKKQRNLALTKF